MLDLSSDQTDIYMYLFIILLGFMMKIAWSVLYSNSYNYSKTDFILISRIMMVKLPMLKENIPQLLTDIIDIILPIWLNMHTFECMGIHLFLCYKKKILSVRSLLIWILEFAWIYSDVLINVLDSHFDNCNLSYNRDCNIGRYSL